MAEKSIGIRIQLNGLNTVITDIKTLENELRKAKEDLKQVEIGGPIFNQLAKEISQAETKLQGLQDSARGISKEKSLEGFGKLGAGISSSFAAAQAAVSLFGKESESVQKAAIQAQNLLTIALSIRGIAEIKVGAQIVARTIAEKAGTIATNASNSATKALFTTLSKNPYGLILAAVGALVAAYITLTDETEKVNKAAESQKKIDELRVKSQEDLIRKTTEQSIKLRALQLIVNDTKKSELERNQALNDLKKELPGLTGLELSRANSLKLINAEIENGLSLGKLEIQSQAIIAVGIEKEIRLREIKGEQDKNNLKVAQIQKQIDFENRKDAPVDYSRQERIFLLQKDQNTLKEKNNKLENEAKTLNRDRNKLEGEYDGIVVKLNANKARTTNIVETYNKELKDETKNTKDVNKVTQEQIDNVSKLTSAYDKQISQLQSTLDAYKKIGELTKVDIQEPAIVKDIEAINDARKALQLPTLESEFKKIGIEISTVNSKFSIQKDVLKKSTDEFGEYYESIRKIISTAAQTESVDEFAETIRVALNDASDLLQSGKITKGAFDAFKALTDQYLGFNKVVKDNPLFPTENLNEFLNLEKQILIATGEYTLELNKQTGQIEKVAVKVKDYTGLQEKQNVLLSEYGIKITDNLNKELTGLNLTGEARKKNIESLLKQGEISKEQADELLSLKTTGEDDTKLNKLIEEIVAARIKALKTVTQTIVQEENQIREFLFRVQEAQKEGLALSGDAIKQTLLNNLNLVIEFTQKQNKVVIDEKKQEVDQLISLEEQLAVKGIDISKLTREEKLKILKAYLAKEKEEKDADAEDDAKRGKLTIETVSEALQQLSSLVGRAASLVAQSYSFQLSQLEKTSKAALEQVTGDTEEANKKRLELESQYQKEKAQIEKAALIKSLQFQLVQAIVDTAQAVTANLEIPPLAIAVGILGAIQVGLITQQLNAAQSLAGGGMVMGPLHEQGGVSFASGGVNLEGGESVINRQSSMNYGGLLSSINQMGGGAPLVNNPSNSLSEERLIQAIAKSRQEPIRAYVMNSEITNGQAINRRLEQLSTI
jgi:FtsZ-binding cell division protein ZapB